jgi:hypothetical protein
VGASWVANNILEKYPDAPISVYMVWVPQMGASRDNIDANLFGDERVKTYWDQGELAGLAIADDVQAFEWIPWDVYTLYGPDARWKDGPPDPADWGAPVIAKTDSLGESVEELVAS